MSAPRPVDIQAVRDRLGEAPEGEQERLYGELFPVILTYVLEHNQSAWPDAPAEVSLVATLGLSPEPLAYSFALIRPRRLLVLCSEKSKAGWDWARAVVPPEVLIACREMRPVILRDPNDPVELYAQVREWVAGAGEKVVADVTGGTKAMSGSLALAAQHLGMQVIYWESETKHGLYGRHPVPGSERLRLLPDPVAEFGDRMAGLAQALAEEGDYEGAADALDRAARRAIGRPAAVLGVWARIARAYASWDRLDVAQARESLAKAVRNLPGIVRTVPESASVAKWRPRLERQLAALEALERGFAATRGGDRLSALQDREFVTALSGFFLHAARRRLRRREPETAALLAYRLMELAVQAGLARHGLDSAAPDYDVLAAEKRARIQRALGRGGEALPAPLALSDGATAVTALEDVDLPLQEVRRRARARNESLYAHGFQPVSCKEAENAVAFGRELAVRLLKPLAIGPSDWEELVFVPFQVPLRPREEEA